jgi:hypothetical protein
MCGIGACDTGEGHVSAIDDPEIAAVGGALDMRQPVAPFGLRHAVGPHSRMLLNVVVSADQTVIQFHVFWFSAPWRAVIIRSRLLGQTIETAVPFSIP